MIRTDFWLLLAFAASVAVAVAVAFGNPLRLEGDRLQELFGYLLSLVLTAAVLFATASLAVLRSPTTKDSDVTHTEPR